jgi:hypothetical protein
MQQRAAVGEHISTKLICFGAKRRTVSRFGIVPNQTPVAKTKFPAAHGLQCA